jgi:two-component system chemotaxis response regulator CheY
MALAATNQRYRKINILVVDDSKSMRDVIAFTICAEGYECELANNGVMALQLAQNKHFDLILTDINMPVMNGITLTGELRKLPGYKHTPILILTTECSSSMKKQGRGVGATGWIIKPFNGEKLIDVIEKVTS